MDYLLVVADITAFFLAIFVFERLWTRRTTKGFPLPPGPRGLPLIGNVLDMPTSREWETFAEWGRKWGDLTYISVLGQPMLVLNSPDAAEHLLDKKSATYSERPFLTVAGEMIGWNQTLVFLQNNARLREYRRVVAQMVGSYAKVEQLAHIIEGHTSQSLLHILHRPQDLAHHLRKNAARIILELSHGYQVTDDDDHILRTVTVAVEEFSSLTRPGAYLADVFPSLRYVPSWMPGARWKRGLSSYVKHLEDMCEVPFQHTKHEMALGKAAPSMVSVGLEDDPSAEEEFNVKAAAASFYSGGADTTVSLARTFYLAMMSYPAVQKKAQQEIDSVVGGERLPSLADRDRLPYLSALISELFRWHPVAPLGVAHRSNEDDVHNGHFIPKSTIVIPNIWMFCHDPNVYDNPSSFDPDRFMGDSPARDPLEFAFGFGRRICPGRYFAEASIFATCAMSLAVFDITKPVVDGREVEPTIEFTSGTISHPLPFECTIRPRTAKAEALIRSINGTHPGGPTS